MAAILCMVGAVGAVVSVLLIVVLCFMGKKAGAPLALFILSLALVLGSGLLPADEPVNIPFLKRGSTPRAETVQATPVNETVESGTAVGNMIPLGSSFVTFNLHPVTSETGTTLFHIGVGHTTREVIENVSSSELTAFMQVLDFTGTNGNVVLMFEDGTGLSMMESFCTVYADYGIIDVSEGNFTMTERLGSIWNDAETGWSYTTLQEMQAAGQIVMAERNPNKYPTDLDTTMSALSAALSESFGEEHYALEYDDKSATVNVWGDNAAAGAASAAEGDESAIEAWNLVVESQKFLCNTICEQVKALGKDEYYVTLNVLNDLDTSKTLLSILNGLVIYDAVND